MDPVNYLFEEIYRDYWGIPRNQESPARKRGHAPARQQREPLHRKNNAR